MIRSFLVASFFRVSPVILILFFTNISQVKSEISAQPKYIFEENKNQWNKNILFRLEMTGCNLFLEKNNLTYVLYNPEEIPDKHDHPNTHNNSVLNLHAFKVNFSGSSPGVKITGERPSEYYKNYFIGNDPARWASNVKLYAAVKYENLYPNIDANIYTAGNLKYDFIVNPGGVASQIKMEYSGTEKLYLQNGNLYIANSIREVVEQKPYAYQIINGNKVEVPCVFIVKENYVGFAFPKGYNKKTPLIIDPTVVCSTYSGSTADNWGFTATYDDAGNIYIGGIAHDIGYPATLGAYQSFFAGGSLFSGSGFASDIVVSKFNPGGTLMIYSTYIGGSDNDQPQSIVVNKNNELLIYGRTYSSTYPTTPAAYDRSYGGDGDIIISKLNSTGTSLVASTFIGGTSPDGMNIDPVAYNMFSIKYNYGDDARGEIITDANNDCYIASSTQSNNFPATAGCYQGSMSGGSLQDACVFKMSSNLSTLVWSTYLGGSGEDAAYSIKLDAGGNAYVTGGTNSSNFPTTAGTLITSAPGGSADGFISCISNNGTMLQYSTYIGTNQYDQSYFIQMDKNDNVYVYGQTAGNYPVSAGVYSNANGKQFIHKLNSTLTTTDYSTVFGSGNSSPDIVPSAFMVDTCENVYASGWGACFNFSPAIPGSTTGMTTTANAYQSTTDGCDFYFFVLKKNARSLWYATFFGANGLDEHVDGGTSRFDNKGIIYQSVCAGCRGFSTFPTTPGAWSNTNNSTNCNNAVVKIDFQLININAQAIASPNTTGCAPYTVNFINASTGSYNYIWNFGDGSATDTAANPQHTFNNVGSYTVMLVAIDSNSCKMTDTTYLTINVVPPPVINLGNDTILCNTSTMQLDATVPGCTYAWSTGSTLPIILVSTAGVYSVTVNNGYCNVTDNVIVQYVTKPDLGNDTLLCEGQSIQISAGNRGMNYLWSTGETTQVITVSTSGTYHVEVSGGLCTERDTITIDFTPPPVASIGNDTLLCPGASLLLDAGNPGLKYKWSSGETTQQITALHSNIYSVTVTVGNCISNDEIKITIADPIDLGPDYSLCSGSSLTLNAGNPGCSYLWSTGEATQKITVSTPNIYNVEIILPGCILKDTIDVSAAFGATDIFVPNTFTPNKDGLNEMFTAYGIEVISYDMKIFDRWGELIFQTSDIDRGWDGIYKGRLVPNDVYVYKIEFATYCNPSESVKKIGHVLVDK